MSKIKALWNKDAHELTEIEKCLVYTYDQQKYDPDYIYPEIAAAELAALQSRLTLAEAELAKAREFLAEYKQELEDDNLTYFVVNGVRHDNIRYIKISQLLAATEQPK